MGIILVDEISLKKALYGDRTISEGSLPFIALLRLNELLFKANPATLREAAYILSDVECWYGADKDTYIHSHLIDDVKINNKDLGGIMYLGQDILSIRKIRLDIEIRYNTRLARRSYECAYLLNLGNGSMSIIDGCAIARRLGLLQKADSIIQNENLESKNTLDSSYVLSKISSTNDMFRCDYISVGIELREFLKINAQYI